MMPDDRPGDTSVLTSLFRHNTWANLKLLDFSAGLSDDQLQATAVGTYGTIRETLLHFVRAEVDYVNRATGKSPAVPLQRGLFPGFEVLKDSVRWAGDELSQLAVAAHAGHIVRETDPQEPVAVEYPLSSLLVQALNHSTEHRTQVSTIITQLGVEPPDMSRLDVYGGSGRVSRSAVSDRITCLAAPGLLLAQQGRPGRRAAALRLPQVFARLRQYQPTFDQAALAAPPGCHRPPRQPAGPRHIS